MGSYTNLWLNFILLLPWEHEIERNASNISLEMFKEKGFYLVENLTACLSEASIILGQAILRNNIVKKINSENTANNFMI